MGVACVRGREGGREGYSKGRDKGGIDRENEN